MNHVDIVGRITKNPELKSTTNGKSVSSFSVAVDRRTIDGTDFIPCVAWGKTAENLCKYLHRGDRIGISGHLNTRSYEDRNGNNRNVVEVVADEVEFLSDKKKPVSEENSVADDDDLPF